MPESLSNLSSKALAPNYTEVVSFLIKPFLEVPESLRVDCEVSESKSKVWVRLAFEGSDKGRVFGRGGRNIQAIRTVLEGVARASGYSAYLDIYGGFPHGRPEDSEHDTSSQEKPHPRRSGGGKPSSRPRSH